MNESISAAIIVKGRKYEFKRALESIYSQRAVPEEIIVLDSSSDGVIADTIYDMGLSELRYIHISENEDSNTVGKLRNIAVNMATGKYIAFLDSDDEWLADRIWSARQELEECEYDILSCCYAKNIRQETMMLPNYELIDFSYLRKTMMIQNIMVASATIYRVQYLKKIGMFNPNCNYMADWELGLRTCSDKDVKVGFMKECLVRTYVMYDSIALGEDSKREKANMFSYFESEMNDNNVDMNAVPIAICEEYSSKLEETLRRKDSFYQLMCKWVSLKSRNVSVSSILSKCGIEKIAIYGAGKHGRLLYDEIKTEGIVSAIYWVDRNKNLEVSDSIPIVLCEDITDEADAVIVTPYLYFESIKAEVEKYYSGAIISLEDLINEKI